MQQQVWKWQDNTLVAPGTGTQSTEYSQAVSGANIARIPPCREGVTGY